MMIAGTRVAIERRALQLGGVHAGHVHLLGGDSGGPLTTPTPTLEVESCMKSCAKSSTNTNP